MKPRFMFLIAVITLLLAGIVIFVINRGEPPVNFVLDAEHKISDHSERPQGTWLDMRSPSDGSELERIVLDPDDPGVMDEEWRTAYYSRSEDIFWIADMPGEWVNWYGPYEGYPVISR